MVESRLGLGLLPWRGRGQRTLWHLALGACSVLVVVGQPRGAGAQPPGSVLWLTFEEGSGERSSDGSGAGNEGLVEDGGSWTAGRRGGGLSSDGMRKALTVPDLSGLDTRQLTVAFWVKTTPQRGCTTLLAYGRPREGDAVWFSVGEVGDLGAGFRHPEKFQRQPGLRDTGIDVTDGTWHHVAVTWEGVNGTVVLYVDGRERARAKHAGRSLRIPSGEPLTLGAKPGRWSLQCRVAAEFDEVLVAPRVMPPEEVALLAGDGPVADSSPPTAPSGLRTAVLSSREVSLVWDGAEDDQAVAGYRVYRNGELLGWSGTGWFYDDTAPAGAVTYEVEAVDVAGNVSVERVSTTVTVPSSGHLLEILPPGHWYEVPDSSLAQEVRSMGGEGAPQVVRPWCGAIYDTRRDRMVLFCGGHMNYWGNELRAYEVEALRWRQITEPTPRDEVWGSGETQDVNRDGRPASRHTYDGLQYLPERDTLFSSGGSLWPAGDCSGGTWLYDFSADPPESGWTDVAVDRGGCGQTSAYDPVSGLVWYRAGRTLSVFDPSNLEAPWQDVLEDDAFSFYFTSTVDPGRRRLVSVGGHSEERRGRTTVYDISDPMAVTGGVQETSGANEIEASNAPGLVYDPVQDAIVAWHPEVSAEDVFVLDPDGWRWRRIAPAPTNLVVPTEYRHIYSRWRYIPRYNAYMVIVHEEDNVFFYKLGDWTEDDSPPSAPGALSASCMEQGVDLRWEPAEDSDSGIAHYVVLRDGEAIGRTRTTRFLDTMPVSGATHGYSVVAVNRGGLQGPPSETVTVRIEAGCRGVAGDAGVGAGSGGGVDGAAGGGSDGGAGGSSGGSSGGGSGGSDGGTRAMGDEVGGYGCRVWGGPGDAGAGLLVLGLLGVLRRRRRCAR